MEQKNERNTQGVRLITALGLCYPSVVAVCGGFFRFCRQHALFALEVSSSAEWLAIRRRVPHAGSQRHKHSLNSGYCFVHVRR